MCSGSHCFSSKIIKKKTYTYTHTLMSLLYPLLFRPNLHTVVWGGNRLKPWKGLPADGEPIGESWEVSVVPSSTSIVANGPFAGCSLADVINEHPQDILGPEVAEANQRRLPLLVKFIDAAKDLSIQVHPGDEMAMHEHGKLGKTEMWYIIHAEPGAYLYAGFKENIGADEYKRRISDGSITDVLARHEVHTGDVFYIPAGRVHAICGGILLAEIQQSSDVTYRIYDYNRPGTDGKLRELHTELASRALDYGVESEYRTIYSTRENRANLILDTPYFTVRVNELTRPIHRDLMKYGSFIISMCLQGSCTLKVRSTGDEVPLKEGHSCLIPACIADYDLVPDEEGAVCRVLDTFINNKEEGLLDMLTRFLHITRRP